MTSSVSAGVPPCDGGRADLAASFSLEERQLYLGGSDMGNVLSLPPYGCQRRGWYDKRDPIGIEITGHIERGWFGEEAAATEYARKTGRTIRRVGTRRVTTPEWEWMVCHSDREIIKDSRGVGLLSIKCPSLFSFREICRNGLPEAYIAQLQWEMWVTGRKWGSYAVMHLDSWDLRWWDVDRDEDLITSMVQRADLFWAMVQNGPAPEKLDPKDKTCARCQYRERCHPLELPSEAGEMREIEDPELIRLCAERAEYRSIESEAEAARKEKDEQIKARVKGSARCGPFKVLNYQTPRKGYTVKEGVSTVFRVIGG